MSDKDNKSDWYEALKRPDEPGWLENAVQRAFDALGRVFAVIGGILSMAFLIFVLGIVWLYFGLDEHQKPRVGSQPINITWEQARTDCEKLSTEMQADNNCIGSDDCVMTRDELAEAEKRRDEYLDKFVRGICFD